MSEFTERSIWTPDDAKQLVGRRVQLRNTDVVTVKSFSLWVDGDYGILYPDAGGRSIYANYSASADSLRGMAPQDIVAYEGPAIGTPNPTVIDTSGHAFLMYVQELEEENQRLKDVLEAVEKAIKGAATSE